MAFVQVPKDLTKVKTKVAFNLTARQLICFPLGLVFGLPVYFLTKNILGSTISMYLMIFICIPFFVAGIFERNGKRLEHVLRDILYFKYVNSRRRVYKHKITKRELAIYRKKKNS